MPELPEVETTKNVLKQKVLKRTFLDVWTDWEKMIKKPSTFEKFRRKLERRTINSIRRWGKNIIFDLSGGFSLLVHQKMTGHLLYGEWREKDGFWESTISGPLKTDKMNGYIRLIFFLDNGKQIALSDLRRFAKVELATTEEIEKSLEDLGPEASEVDFTCFGDRVSSRKKSIKKVLLDQSVLAGIGNIYADESLFGAGISPLRKSSELRSQELEKLYSSVRKTLKEATKLQGTSVSDYRIPTGEKGKFGEKLKVYQKEGVPCIRCKTPIKRVKINQRSSHFCPHCQT